MLYDWSKFYQHVSNIQETFTWYTLLIVYHCGFYWGPCYENHIYNKVWIYDRTLIICKMLCQQNIDSPLMEDWEIVVTSTFEDRVCLHVNLFISCHHQILNLCKLKVKYFLLRIKSHHSPTSQYLLMYQTEAYNVPSTQLLRNEFYYIIPE